MTLLHGIACFYDVGFGARAVSRKTPIYFFFFCREALKYALWAENKLRYKLTLHFIQPWLYVLRSFGTLLEAWMQYFDAFLQVAMSVIKWAEHESWAQLLCNCEESKLSSITLKNSLVSSIALKHLNLASRSRSGFSPERGQIYYSWPFPKIHLFCKSRFLKDLHQI